MMRALTTVPTLILGVLSVPIGLVGLSGAAYGFTGLVNARAVLLVGLALIGAALAHVIVGVALWRHRRRALPAGLFVCVVGLIYAAYLGQRALTPMGTVRDETGIMQPVYGTTWLAVALVAIPYVIALVCLLIARIRTPKPST